MTKPNDKSSKIRFINTKKPRLFDKIVRNILLLKLKWFRDNKIIFATSIIKNWRTGAFN